MKDTYTPIIGTLGYVISKDQEHVLMVHRIGRSKDDHYGKYNGLGGKMHASEDVVTCMKRELFEEAGIQATELMLKGTINWTNFGPKGQNWLGFIFLITAFEGEVHSNSPEGPLHWVPIEDLHTLPMWEGDKHFLPLIFDGKKDVFHGYMPYNKDVPLHFEYNSLTT